jgi:hypothetical protein
MLPGDVEPETVCSASRRGCLDAERESVVRVERAVYRS